VNKALASASKMADEEMTKITKGMMPPGLGLPGF
jgi:DNA-binding protein YbaB